jgi:hypothetical protein
MAKKPTEGRRKLVEFDAQTWHALNVLDDTANKMSGGHQLSGATISSSRATSKKIGPRISHFAGFVRQRPTLRPAALPPAGQGGRRQFGSDRGHRQRWKLETLQGRSTPDADHGI